MIPPYPVSDVASDPIATEANLTQASHSTDAAVRPPSPGPGPRRQVTHPTQAKGTQ
jgi:hypothetical protein